MAKYVSRSPRRRSISGLAVLASLVMLLPWSARAGMFNQTDQGVALHGYDVVSYFTADAPVPGKPSLRETYQGTTFLFSSEDNRKRFAADPQAYQPVFGGYCAFGIRMGKLLDIDPLAYRLVDGELYLLLNRATMATWEQDTQRNIEIARRLWPELSSGTDPGGLH